MQSKCNVLEFTQAHQLKCVSKALKGEVLSIFQTQFNSTPCLNNCYYRLL